MGRSAICALTALVAALGGLVPSRTSAQSFCNGDCDGDGVVSVAEIIRGVSIALGHAGLEICLAFDVHPDNRVTVDELVAAVTSALDGCRVRPTPTPPASATVTVTATATVTPTLTPVPLVVTTLVDEHVGSLRDRIAAAKDGDTIQFAVSGVITLTGGPIIIDKQLTIAGPGAAQLTVSAGHRNRVFEIRTGPVVLAGLTVADGRVEGDPQTVVGAGILTDGSLELRDCVVRNNQLVAPSGCFGPLSCAGAGVLARASYILRIERSSIIDNDAGNGGGGGIAAGTVFVRDSTISGNRAGAGGGGLAFFEVFPSNIVNTTISDNHTDQTGGGIQTPGNIDLAFVTISNNSAAMGGGGIAFPCSFGPERCIVRYPVFLATIIAGQRAGGDCMYGGPEQLPLGRGANIDDDGSCRLASPTDHSGVVDAGLLPLAATGGPTKTHALQPTSPAVDAVPVDDCIDIDPFSETPYALRSDQRGSARPSGAFCDSGAYELRQDSK